MDYPTMPPEELYRLALDNPDRAYVAVFVLREGAVQAFEHVELSMYPPATLKNDAYTIVFTPEWPAHDEDYRIQWPVVGFPLSDKATVEKILDVHGFHLSPGTPRMMIPTENSSLGSMMAFANECPTPPNCRCTPWCHFPVAYAPNFFTLEGNGKSKIHPHFMSARPGGAA